MFEEMEIQRSAVRVILEPFLSEPSLGATSNKNSDGSAEP
jgi:hypothetical protein